MAARSCFEQARLFDESGEPWTPLPPASPAAPLEFVVPPHGFSGETFSEAFDAARLGEQARRVWNKLQSGKWYTLGELSALTGDPEASVSARLRDLRKPKWGGHVIERRRRVGQHVGPHQGLWEYRLGKRDG